MEIQIKQMQGFVRVSDVQVPDIYNRRFKTGKCELDAVFGGAGFLPGMSFTLAAGPGTGKTTAMLQMLEFIESTGKTTAYVSGEEATAQLAFTCRRIGVSKVSVANMTVIEDIFDIIAAHKFDIVILDSFPTLRSRDKSLRGRQLEEYLSNYITSKSKELECVVGVILHFTKDGKNYKGSTLLPHSVDCNVLMYRSKEDATVREFEVTKNRFGVAGYSAFYMTERGLDFTTKVEVEESENNISPKKGKIQQYKDQIMDKIKQDGEINLQTACKLLECSIKAQQTLRDLTLQGSIKKEGRGQNAVWSI